MTEEKVNKLLTCIGNPGKFQLLAYAFLSVNWVIIYSQHLTMVFYSAKAKYHCNTDNIQLVPTVTKNNERQWDGCHLYAGNDTTQTIPCTNGWTYYLEKGETTIISEFDLVCDDAYKADLATTVYFCGVTLGGFPFGFLSDRYGRKPVYGATLLATGVLGMAIFAFRTYVAFVVLRFCLGFVIQGLQNCCFVLVMELFTTKYRSQVGIMTGVTSGIGALLFGLLAYLVKDWKYIQLTISIVPFLQLLTLCTVPESIRWYLLHGHFNKAEAVVKRVVSFNNLPFPRDLFHEIRLQLSKEASSSTQQKKANVLDMFRSRLLRKISLILVVVWFTVNCAFYGLYFNISYLFGNKYVNFAIGSVADFCAVSLMLLIVPRLGRRRPISMAFFLASVANVTCAITTSVATGSTSIKMLGTAAALLGKACMGSTICVMFLFTSELYPTIVRNVSLGVNTFWSRIGGMAAPQIFFLGMSTSTSVPYSIIGVLTLLSSFLVLLLPETHNKALVDRLGRAGQSRTSLEIDELQKIVKDEFICESSV